MDKMDRKIEHKGFLRKKHIPYIAGGVVVLVIIGWLVFGDHRTTYRVDSQTVTVSQVRAGEFSDYVRLNGVVQPISTVQLTPLETGVVQERVVEEGTTVQKGQIIVRLSNPQLNIQILESEASLAEKENFLRNTRVQMEQEKLNLRRERLTLEMEVGRKRRKFEQDSQLWAEKLISKEEYIQSKEDYELAKSSMELVIERQVQDSIYRALQVDNMELNLRSMQQNMVLVRQRVDNLNVRALIDGELGMLDVELGQSVTSGQKLGQISDLSAHKVETLIDEHYIDRVVEGLEATFERGDEQYSVRVAKVFPEVREGKFRTWLTFTDEKPENMRTGQTYYLNLELGQPSQAIIIPRGGFYQSTGGQWIYVVEGDKAVRRSIRISRQNPQYYEVVEGLQAGEEVITSSYESFGDTETITLN